MSDQALLSTLKALGYDNSTIRQIMATAEAAEVDSLRRRQLLSPLQAAAQSPHHAAQLRRIDTEIYHASGCRWRLPTDGSNVKLADVDANIRCASIETRARIKAGLRSLNLIEA